MRSFILFTLLLSHYCSTFAQSSLTKIAIDPTSQPKGQLALSDLVESVEYIPLETNDKCLVGNIFHYDISENYILLSCRVTFQVYLFKRDGRFVSKIGNIGQGPGEYVTPSSLFIDEVNGQVLVLSSGHPDQLLKYTLDGKYIRAQKKGEGTGGSLRYLFNNHYISTNTTNIASIPFAYTVLNRNLELVKQAIKTIPVELAGGRQNSAGMSKAYLYNGQLHVWECSLNDTVYAINRNLTFIPKYLIDAGRYKITLEKRQSENFLEALRNSVICDRMYETPSYILLAYIYGDMSKPCYAYYDKQTKKLLYFPSSKGISNDYDGGIDFWPQRQDENTWYTFYNAHVIDDELSAKKKITPKGPATAIQKFSTFHKKLDPEDNPVLMIVKLKK